ncbi:MAG: cell division protein FtsZ, partial [Deltaproteobacteria bacterium]|nr:cell division protein FtsZ [Deltaproteobacteria bacterium]
IIFGAVIDEEMGDAVNVTVIATGFGRSEEIPGVRMDRVPSRRSVVQPQDLGQAEKPVAKTVIPAQPHDMQIPAFIRKSKRETNSRHLSVVDDYAQEHDEDLDIPTFLRKQAE